MKKLLRKVLSFATAVALGAVCLASVSAAESVEETTPLTGGAGIDVIGSAGSADTFPDNVVCLDNLNVSVTINEDFASIREQDGFVYIYALGDGYIPYVMIGCYDVDPAAIADSFTAYMAQEHPDLDVDFLQEGYEAGGLSFTKVVYHYALDKYQVTDTRLFCGMNNRSYMIAAKEVPDVPNSSLPSETYLDDIAGSLAPLAGGYDSYVYHVYDDNALVMG